MRRNFGEKGLDPETCHFLEILREIEGLGFGGVKRKTQIESLQEICLLSLLVCCVSFILSLRDFCRNNLLFSFFLTRQNVRKKMFYIFQLLKFSSIRHIEGGKEITFLLQKLSLGPFILLLIKISFFYII